MKYSQIIGMSIPQALEYLTEIGVEATFVETKDVKNVYDTKRVVRCRPISDTHVEVLYTGFPLLEENINE